MEPLLSIVIANYNYGRFLEEAIQSVIAQDMGDQVELIICDAASTDNSVDIIKKYANGLPPNANCSDWLGSSNHNSQTPPLITWWCTEKDGGQSAAFNKGFSHAHGRFLTWLNADDVLMPGALRLFSNAVVKYPDCKWFVGGVMWLDKEMRVVRMRRGRNFSKMRAVAGDVSVWGPSSFFTKELFYSVDGVDERFNYMMDTHLWFKFHFLAGETYRVFCDYAWGLRLHEDAKMSAHMFKSSGQQDPNHRKWDLIRQENMWLREVYDAPKKMSILRRVISIEFLGAISSLVDTYRYKGKHYKLFFQRKGGMS